MYLVFYFVKLLGEILKTMFECECNSKSGITELVLIGSRIITRGRGGPKGPLLFKEGLRLVKRYSQVLQVSYLFSKKVSCYPSTFIKRKETLVQIIRAYTAFYLGGTPSLKTGTRPPSCLLLDNLLYMPPIWNNAGTQNLGKMVQYLNALGKMTLKMSEYPSK